MYNRSTNKNDNVEVEVIGKVSIRIPGRIKHIVKGGERIAVSTDCHYVMNYTNIMKSNPSDYLYPSLVTLLGFRPRYETISITEFQK
jgi:hypothetical protein